MNEGYRETASNTIDLMHSNLIQLILAALLFAGSALLAHAEDKPANRMPLRGFCISAPGMPELDRFLKFIDEGLAPRGVNALILRVDYNYQYTSHPELKDPNGLTKEAVGKLVAACRSHQIRLIPQINLLGHQSWDKQPGNLLKTYPEFDETPWVAFPEKYKWPNADGLYCKSYCPLHPKVHEVVFAMMDEICDVFEADAFHAGLDEVFYLGMDKCPRCGGKDKAELFAGEVKAIHGRLAQKKRQLWMWGDRLLDGKVTGIGEWEASYNNTARAIDLIPKDIMICDWHYERPDQTAVYFAAKGFSVATCPWNKTAVAVRQVQDMAKFRAHSAPEMRDRLQGIVQTVWSGAGGFLEEYDRAKKGPDDGKPSAGRCFLKVMDEMDRADQKAPAVLGAAGKWWLTRADRSALYTAQPENLAEVIAAPENTPCIEVDANQKYQTMDGFGFALTGGSAVHIAAMTPAARATLLRELFTTEGGGIGISYLRVSIGASDLNDHVFSYDDLPPGQTDPRLAKFSLDPDRGSVIPVLKEILALAPHIKILASPWSAPTWMKTNQKVKGGQLLPKYYSAYAKYLVKYLQSMQAEGIRIDALTIQNEPLNDGNTPSMQMFALDQALFIKKHLGPALKAAKLDTKIILFDHNCDHPEYAISILQDPQANRYVDGSGFHHYAGELKAMSTVHEAFPAKHLYFTEQMVIERPGSKTIDIQHQVSRLIVGTTRNWSRNVLLWNLAADPNNDPHTNDGGCSICQGAITIDGDKVTRNIAYYTIAHASQWVRPESVRIASTEVKGLPNAAFLTPDGRTVLIVTNQNAEEQTVEVRVKGHRYLVPLPGRAAATCVW